MKSISDDIEKNFFSKDKITVLYILAFFAILLFLIREPVKYSIFIHAVYATFLLAMGIIIFNVANLNKEEVEITIGMIFAVAGLLEIIFMFRISIYGVTSYYLNFIIILISGVTDLFPIMSIYLFFKLKDNSKTDKAIIKNIITSIIVGSMSLLAISVLFNSSLFDIKNLRTVYILEVIVSMFIFISSYFMCKNISGNSYCLDDREKYLIKTLLTITMIARVPNVLHIFVGNTYIIDTINQVITNISIYYLYQYTVYTNVKKTYKTLNNTNTQLLIKTESLKEKNKKLLQETDKIGVLKEILTIKEKKLQSTLNASINGIVVFDKNNEITYANKAFLSFFMDDKGISNFKFSEDLKPMIKNYDDLSKNIEGVFENNSINVDFIHTVKGRIYQATFSPLMIEGEIQGALCILIDKTKRKEFERKIIEANQRYESFLESIGDGIVVLEENKRIYVNKACKDIFGKEIDKIDFSEDCDKDNTEKEYLIDGKKIYVEKSVSRYTKNNKDKTIIVVRDITSRKIAQLKLKDSQKSYARFIDILPDGICLLDPDFKISYANRSLLDMLEIGTIKEIVGIDVKKMINLTEDKKNKFEKKMNSVLEENEYLYLLEYEFITSKNNKVQVEVNALPFNIEDNNFIMLITKDLTHKRTSEMAEKELLERLKTDKIKTEFFANMSHELKTPLNVISSSNQLVDSFYKSGKIKDYNDNVKSHVDLVRQSSYRLQRLINNIIDLTKMESGFYYLKLDKHNIVEVIEDLFEYVNEYANKKDLDLVFDTELEEIYVYIDKQEIERVILNLLSNCIKFTDNGGSVSVNIYTGDENVFVSVKDTGVGIPKSKLELVFEEFAQVDKTLSRNTEGSGIGLTIVKNLVELHGGEIEVISNVDVGTEFIVSIPMKNLNYEECQKNKRIYNIEEKVRIEFSDIYY